MWSLKNETPYKAERGWYRDINGAEVWVVAIKATYEIQSDGSVIPGIPLPINTGAVMYPDSDEMLYDTDMGPEKMATDILLNGHAWSPMNKKVSHLIVGMKVGNICRLARVNGQRVWNGKEYSAPARFSKMPLRYANMVKKSSHQHDICNPQGIDADQMIGGNKTRLPEIEFLSDAGYPGFGAVPRNWPGRACYAGTYDQDWEERRSPLLPKDLDPGFWQCAPPCQYAAGQLRGNEIVTLANLTSPDFSVSRVISFAIPKISLHFSTRFTDGSTLIHRAKMHTVIIEPDYPRLSVVWHSALPCHRLVNMLDTTTVTEKIQLNPRPHLLPTDFKEWEQL